MRPLTVFQPIDHVAAPLDLAADPTEWLPEGSRPAGPGTWTIPLRLRGMTRRVRCEIRDPLCVGRAVWRGVSWVPVAESGDPIPAEKMLPAFDGEIGLHRPTDEAWTLVLHGAYSVPLGVIGEVADSVVLRRAARATGARFLGDVVTRASARPLAVSRA